MFNSYNLALIEFGISMVELYKNNQKTLYYVTQQYSVTKHITLAVTNILTDVCQKQTK